MLDDYLLAERIVNFLNEAYKLDPFWVAQLVEPKFCNGYIGNHSTIQTTAIQQPYASPESPLKFQSSMVGFLNGLVGEACTSILAIYDHRGKLEGFKLSDEARAKLYKNL